MKNSKPTHRFMPLSPFGFRNGISSLGFYNNATIISGVVFQPFTFLERALVRDGNESLVDFTPPEGGPNYGFPGFTIAPNGDYIVSYRSATSVGQVNGTSSLRINISTASLVGRSFLFQKRDEIIIETGSSYDPYSTALTTIGNTIWLTFERDFTGTPQRLTFYCTSSDNGRTWSSASQFPATGSLYTSAGGKIINLGEGVYLKPDFYRNTGENRKTSFLYRSTDAGQTWNTHSIIAQDPNPSGTQWEEPHIVQLQDGRLFGLLRVNDISSIYQVTSSDSGTTWSTPQLAFLGNRWPSVIQTQNGMLVSMVARSGTAEPELFYSRNTGSSWTSAGRLGCDFPGGGTFQYGGLQEISPNYVGACWSFIAAGQAAGVAFGKFLTMTSSSVPYVYHQPRVMDTYEAINAGWNFGNNNLLSASTSFLLEVWFRFRNRNQPGTIIRNGNAANNQQNIDLRLISATQRLEMTIASGTNLFNRWVSGPSLIYDDEWYQFLCLFSGSGATDADRCRIWLGSGSVTNEVTSMAGAGFSGSMPTRTTAPTLGTGRWTIGTDESGSLSTGFHGYISEVRIWDNVDVTTALQNITGGILYNNRLPLHPASCSLGLPTSWIACDVTGSPVDLVGRLNNGNPPIVTSTPGFDTFTILGHGWLSVSGTYSGGI